MIRFDDAATLPLLYHLNSEPWQNTEAYEGTPYEVEYKQFAGAPSTPLPPPSESALRTVLIKRESHRYFSGRPLALASLSDLLANGGGISRQQELAATGLVYLMRTTPSAGGLFPLEFYLVTQGVEGLADGLHHYDLRAHALETLRSDVSISALKPFLLVYPFVERANVIIFLAAVFHRTLKKYGPRGYRYVLLEAGHVAQNICLSATQQGLGSLCVGGYEDAALNHWLGLDGRCDAVVYSVAVGQMDEPDGEIGSA
jgi:SagB-type dehydrogenase family enzyme